MEQVARGRIHQGVQTADGGGHGTSKPREVLRTSIEMTPNKSILYASHDFGLTTDSCKQARQRCCLPCIYATPNVSDLAVEMQNTACACSPRYSPTRYLRSRGHPSVGCSQVAAADICTRPSDSDKRRKIGGRRMDSMQPNTQAPDASTKLHTTCAMLCRCFEPRNRETRSPSMCSFPQRFCKYSTSDCNQKASMFVSTARPAK